MKWFGEGPDTEAQTRSGDLRDSGFEGPIDQDGNAVMSRTDSNGRPLGLFQGGTGTGTADETRARGLFGRR